MAHARSRRQRLLESLRQTLNDKLHERVDRTAMSSGRHQPEDTSQIYAAAVTDAPELLDQLLLVHHRVRQERGEVGQEAPLPDDNDGERRRMLSAVRATVRRSALRFNL